MYCIQYLHISYLAMKNEHYCQDKKRPAIICPPLPTRVVAVIHALHDIVAPGPILLMIFHSQFGFYESITLFES